MRHVRIGVRAELYMPAAAGSEEQFGLLRRWLSEQQNLCPLERNGCCCSHLVWLASICVLL